MLRDTLKRMDTELKDVVHYTLDIHGVNHKMNDYIGKKLRLIGAGLLSVIVVKNLINFIVLVIVINAFGNLPWLLRVFLNQNYVRLI